LSAVSVKNSTNLSAEFFTGNEQFMLSVFADDSSDETQQRTVAVAGVIASDEEWNRLDRTWLERTGGIPFHATDCESDRGAYAGYCHLDNQNLYKDLATILARSDSWGWGAALDLASYREFFVVDQETCYYKAFLAVIDFFAKFARDRFQEKVKFTFDRRIQSSHNAAELYALMSNDPNNAVFSNPLEFASSTEQPRIQMADLWAREVMKELDNRIGPTKRPRRRSFIALNDSGHFGCDVFLREYFQDMQNKLGQAGQKDPEFNREAYAEWLSRQKHQDTNANRIRFLLWFSQREKRKGLKS
jgi:hypothetical protein